MDGHIYCLVHLGRGDEELRVIPIERAIIDTLPAVAGDIFVPAAGATN
jgi:hypothetical protein